MLKLEDSSLIEHALRAGQPRLPLMRIPHTAHVQWILQPSAAC